MQTTARETLASSPPRGFQHKQNSSLTTKPVAISGNMHDVPAQRERSVVRSAAPARIAAKDVAGAEVAAEPGFGVTTRVLPPTMFSEQKYW